jgi:hypothetical protein
MSSEGSRDLSKKRGPKKGEVEEEFMPTQERVEEPMEEEEDVVSEEDEDLHEERLERVPRKR